MLIKTILLGLAVALFTTILTTVAILALGIPIKTYAIFLYIPAIMLCIIGICPIICSNGDKRLFSFFAYQRETQRNKYQKFLDKMIVNKKAAVFMLLCAFILAAAGFSLSKWVGF